MQTSSPSRGQALVIGGGIAGLVAARVLADRFKEVVILDSDDIETGSQARRGIPQSYHPHGMLARGAQIFEELFPGLHCELAERGSPSGDFGKDFRFRYPWGWVPNITVGIDTQVFSRGLLESVVRARLLSRRNVSLIGGARVTGLVADPNSNSVRGVRVGTEQYLSDIVVVAAGRTSKVDEWMQAANFNTGHCQRVDGHLAYSTALYRIVDGDPPPWLASSEYTYAPYVCRGGTAVRIENDTWMVCLFGAGGELPPTDEAGFSAYAASLTNHDIRDMVARSNRVSPARRYAGLAGEWHRYDRVKNWPSGLVILGDAVCSLSPLYGQGMTVAGEQGLLLARCLDEKPDGSAEARFQRKSASTVRLAWMISANLDLGWNGHGLPWTTAAVQYAMHYLLTRESPELYRRTCQVQHMIRPPWSVLLPPRLSRLPLFAYSRQ